MPNHIDVLAVNAALDLFEEISPERYKVVEMKFFAGMTNEEVAEAMDISLATVKRRWRSARTWMIDYFEK